MVSEMETLRLPNFLDRKTLAEALKLAAFMVSEMVLVVSEMFEPCRKPRQYWACGVPSLY